ncbi:MoaD/ThiS family protein [Flammeovirgaceae bacterium SG7u.111]|nr:MoaD/ThiS family protein [Flammeovirgaceae bacterium SG7u.132]WPO36897.1 MoaD/ThiS family protein [Flammeovirgaceae bacterium SG7u.111]
MKITILCFGITRDIIGKFEVTMELKSGANVQDLLNTLETNYPKLQGLNSLKVAANSEYIPHSYEINPNDEIALIPPVSGG